MAVKYTHSVGRRKQAVARIRLFKGKDESIVNDKPFGKYFPTLVAQGRFLQPFTACSVLDKYYVTIKVNGSGITSQLDACVHGIARALVKVDEKFKPMLKKQDLLTRDPRKRERRKVGTGGKARRKKQSPKR